MIALVLYVVAFWGLTAALAWRCLKKWRRGADQLRAEQWDALALTLLVMTLPVIGTLGLLDAAPALTASLSGTLLLGSGGCHVAKSVSTRRADTAARAIRTGLGLPVARRLLRTTTVAALWFTAAVGTMLVWMAVAVVRDLGQRQQMTADEHQVTIETTVNHAVAATLAVIALGVVHCLIQEIRRGREQRRVRAAEQHYLAAKD
ncbi:hypothetical protein [Streptomyces hundungensis]|uniref:hypothetical protein n=1 Tax=Streptomyces hundungensis TaxID=1077946 RepID=UPI0031F17247